MLTPDQVRAAIMYRKDYPGTSLKEAVAWAKANA
jgi:hypothetical protein